MAHKFSDRVGEITTSTGTGNIVLGGTTSTYRTFASVLSEGDTADVAIVHTVLDEWEVVKVTMTSGDLVRAGTPHSSSNGGLTVTFSAGTKDVFIVSPSVFYADGDRGDITTSGGGLVWTIDDGAVDNAAMADMAADTIKGRANGAGTGDPTDLTAAQVRTIINVENGATADQSAAELLTAIKTVDGTGSGLDADLLDGSEASAFMTLAGTETSTGTKTFQTTADYGEPLTIEGTNAANGPTLAVYGNSASPATNDIVGEVKFYGKDSGGNKNSYASVSGQIEDTTDTSEDGWLLFQTKRAGTLSTRGYFGDGLIIGSPTGSDQGAGTINATGLYVNSSAVMDMASAQTTTGSKVFQTTSYYGEPVTVSSTNTTEGGPVLAMYHNSASPANNDNIGIIKFYGKDSGATKTGFAQITCSVTDVTDTSEDASVSVQAMVAGTSATRVTIGDGMRIGSPTGGLMGNGTLNTTGLYVNGNSVGGELLSTATASSSATVDITLPTGYKHFRLEFDNMGPVTDGVWLNVRVSQDGGSSFLSGASDYSFQGTGRNATAIQSFNDSAQSEIWPTSFSGWGNTATEKGCGYLTLFSPHQTQPHQMEFFAAWALTDSTRAFAHGIGNVILNTTAYNAVRFFYTSGNISTGTFRLIGYV